MRAILAFFVWTVLFLLPMFSPATTCSTTIPANVIFPDGTAVRDLSAGAFQAEVQKKPVSISALGWDHAPRQVLLIVDNSPAQTADEWTIALDIATHVVAQARPQDQLGLLTARGERLEVRFGASRAQLKQALESLRAMPRKKRKKSEVLAAVDEGTNWFSEKRIGNAILLITADAETDIEGPYKKALRKLAESETRLFVFLLGTLIHGSIFTYQTGWTPDPMGLVHSIYSPNRTNLRSLSWETSGSFFSEPTEGHMRRYRLSPERMDTLRLVAARMYSSIAENYRVQLTGLPQKDGILWLRLSDAVQKQAPKAMVFYKRYLPGCSDVAASKP